MENLNSEFYRPEYQDEFEEYGGYDDLVDTVDGEFDDEDDVAEYDDDDDVVEFDDDDDGEFDDDDDAEFDDDDDGEFLGAIAGAALPFVAKGIGGAIKGVSGLLRGPRRRRRRYLRSRRYTSGGPRVARRIATASRSFLTGRIRTRSGRSVRFRLPPNVATKRDIVALKRGISVNAKAIRSNTKGVKANAKSIVSTSRQLSSIDKKHTAASQTQNRILNSLNKRVVKVKKELENAEQRQRTMQMFQFLMPPELSEITLDQFPNTPVKIKDSEFKTNLLPMMMAMGSGGSSGDMMSNPMMMFMMMDAMKGDND